VWGGGGGGGGGAGLSAEMHDCSGAIDVAATHHSLRASLHAVPPTVTAHSFQQVCRVGGYIYMR